MNNEPDEQQSDPRKRSVDTDEPAVDSNRKLRSALTDTWWQPIVVLGVFALLVAAALATLHDSQHERIATNQRAYEMRQIRELLQQTDYDNDVFSDLVYVDQSMPSAALLGAPTPQAPSNRFICRATARGHPNAAILQVTAHNGYAGPIDLLVAIYADGTLAGVRVVAHRETPGLGDKIDLDKSNWVLQFAGRSLRQPPDLQWRVRKDGGHFDQITGATVTPRAIVAAVKNALEFFAEHSDEIFAAPAQSLLTDSTKSRSNTPSHTAATVLTQS